MQLSSLTKITKTKKRRLGQGHGSGRGKTGGRGTKGQKARRTIPLSFEGGALPLIKRLPFMRGRGKNKSFRKGPIIVNLKRINFLKKDSIVDVKNLVVNKIVMEEDAKAYGVKILGDGELNVPLIVKLPVSRNARKKIEKVGGRVERDTPNSK